MYIVLYIKIYKITQIQKKLHLMLQTVNNFIVYLRRRTRCS